MNNLGHIPLWPSSPQALHHAFHFDTEGTRTWLQDGEELAVVSMLDETRRG